MRDTPAPHEFLSFTGSFFKATPAEEGGDRFLYLEASNEALDYQNERVLAKALAGSADYFLRYGNFDIQHRSMIGLANGDPNYHLHEIGRPEQVKADGTRTFVKGIIFQGDTQVAACANDFWDSITKLRPAQRWYPSVAGKIQEVHKSLDPVSKESRRTISKVLWANVGFSRTPVNPAVPEVSTVPFGVLAKCWGIEGLDLTKALTAGYGTDMATLSGGAALREQSLDHKPQDYWAYREHMARDLRTSAVPATSAAILAHGRQAYGLPVDEAGDWGERFLTDLNDHLAKRSRTR